MKKIIVIGCPGAGKSTFSRKLKKKINIPLYYMDQLWHNKNHTTITQEELKVQLNKIFKTESWIVDGNYLSTLEMRIKACDTIFLLDYPVELCLSSAKERIGKKRVDMPWIETEFDEEFKQWIQDFPTLQLPTIYALLKKYHTKNIIIFKTRQEANHYLSSINSKR